MSILDIQDVYKTILTKEIIGPVTVLLVTLILFSIIDKIARKISTPPTHQIHTKLYNERKAKVTSVVFSNVIKFFIIVIDIIVVLKLFGINSSTFFASLGIFSAVIGLAFQDVLKDIIAGIFIVLENQYAVGDTIAIGDFKGEVIALGLKTTRIKSYEGDIKIISNRDANNIINYSLEKSLAIVNVYVSYEEDLLKVESVLEELCKRLTNELPNLRGPVELLGVNELGSSGIEYRLSVLTKSMEHFDIQRKIMREIKLEFDKHNIEIPYNQLVIHNA